jgi:hypothetical protein
VPNIIFTTSEADSATNGDANTYYAIINHCADAFGIANPVIISDRDKGKYLRSKNVDCVVSVVRKEVSGKQHPKEITIGTQQNLSYPETLRRFNHDIVLLPSWNTAAEISPRSVVIKYDLMPSRINLPPNTAPVSGHNAAPRCLILWGEPLYFTWPDNFNYAGINFKHRYVVENDIKAQLLDMRRRVDLCKILTSRRTNLDIWGQFLQKLTSRKRTSQRPHWDYFALKVGQNNIQNPFKTWLAEADVVIVTQDSGSMLSELVQLPGKMIYLLGDLNLCAQFSAASKIVSEWQSSGLTVTPEMIVSSPELAATLYSGGVSGGYGFTNHIPVLQFLLHIQGRIHLLTDTTQLASARKFTAVTTHPMVVDEWKIHADSIVSSIQRIMADRGQPLPTPHHQPRTRTILG